MPTGKRNRLWLWVMVAAAALTAVLDASGQDQDHVAKGSPRGAAAGDNPLVERWKREAADNRVVLETSPDSSNAFTRISNHSLAAKRRDRVVWEAPIDANDRDPRKPYCVRWDVGPRT